MLFADVLAILAIATLPPADHVAPSTIQDPPATVQDGAPTQLEDIVVTGRRLDDLIEDFVGEVAEPNARRGLARWDQRVCVGVVNLKTDAAEYIADRVSTVAQDLGLTAGEPGCSPNIMVVATGDGNQLAQDLIKLRKRALRIGGSGMDRGGDALQDFQDTPRPVRWWQVSAPIDSETGQIAVRIPGQCQAPCTATTDYAPTLVSTSATRLRTRIVDRLLRAIVIVDVDEVSALSINQLADYIAMVSLAQIDPDGDTRNYASILNVFDQPDAPEYLTDWDNAYLAGLYNAEQNQTNRRAGRSEVVRSIRNAHRDMVQSGDPESAD